MAFATRTDSASTFRPAALALIAALLALLSCVPVAPLAAQAPAEAAPQENQQAPRRGRRWLDRFRRPNVYSRSHDLVKEAFRDVGAAAGKSTVRIFAEEKPVALGTVVDSDGLILTKASELKSAAKLSIKLSDGRQFDVQSVATDVPSDLALLRAPAKGLQAVKWAERTMPVGAWLVTPGLDPIPESIGVVSVENQSIPKPRAVLGVLLRADPKGARVDNIMPRSGAQKAGMEAGDVIIAVDGKKIESRDNLIALMGDLLPGDAVELTVLRGEDEKKLNVELSDYDVLTQGRVEMQNSLGGPLSRRRAPFAEVIQHDSVLRPEQCGGPICDLNGQTVGVNIARAGRVASYAIPAGVVQRVIKQLLQQESEQAAKTVEADSTEAVSTP
jgi:serine protease Do